MTESYLHIGVTYTVYTCMLVANRASQTANIRTEISEVVTLRKWKRAPQWKSQFWCLLCGVYTWRNRWNVGLCLQPREQGAVSQRFGTWSCAQRGRSWCTFGRGQPSADRLACVRRNDAFTPQCSSQVLHHYITSHHRNVRWTCQTAAGSSQGGWVRSSLWVNRVSVFIFKMGQYIFK